MLRAAATSFARRAAASARPDAVAAAAAAAGARRPRGLSSQVADDDPEALERAAARQRRGESRSPIKGLEAGWEAVLASDSEAIVKAEREGDGDEPIAALRERSVRYSAEERHSAEGRVAEVAEVDVEVAEAAAPAAAKPE
jgi:hypothetical protein